MFETSPTCTKLDQALCKAQSMMDAAIKESSNTFFKDKEGKPSKYANLEAVWNACRNALAKNEINVTQWPVTSDDGKLHLITRIAHGGEWMKAESSIPVSKADPHGYGSAITYLRRFALMAALSIVTEDDDGNAAIHPPSPFEHPRPAPMAVVPRPAFEGNKLPNLTEAQVKRMYAIGIKEFKWTVKEIEEYLKTRYHIHSPNQLTRDAYEEVCNSILPMGKEQAIAALEQAPKGLAGAKPPVGQSISSQKRKDIIDESDVFL